MPQCMDFCKKVILIGSHVYLVWGDVFISLFIKLRILRDGVVEWHQCAAHAKQPMAGSSVCDEVRLIIRNMQQL